MYGKRMSLVRGALALLLAVPAAAAPRTVTWTTPIQGQVCGTADPVTAYPVNTQIMNVLELRAGGPTGSVVWRDSVTRTIGLPNTTTKDFPVGTTYLTWSGHPIGAMGAIACTPATLVVVVAPDTCLCPPVKPGDLTVR